MICDVLEVYYRKKKLQVITGNPKNDSGRLEVRKLQLSIIGAIDFRDIKH